MSREVGPIYISPGRESFHALLTTEDDHVFKNVDINVKSDIPLL